MLAHYYLCFLLLPQALAWHGCKDEKAGEKLPAQKCAILTRLKQSCLSGRSPTRGRDCFNLATRHHARNDRESLKKARHFYKLACSYSESDGCHNLGLMYLRGEGGEKKPGDSRAAFKKACRLGAPGSCMNLGEMMRRGVGGKKDVSGGMALLKKACAAEEGAACGKISLIWSQGWEGKVDLGKAIRWGDKGCAAGNEMSCRLSKHYRKRLDTWKPGQKGIPDLKKPSERAFGKTLIDE
jgi:TPR repeat protein